MGSRWPIGNTRTIILKTKNMPRKLKQGFGKASLLNHGSGEGVKDYLGIPTINLTDAKLKLTLVKVKKVYHIPVLPWYEKTKINTDKGERWLCTEEEAQAAGWQAKN